MKKVFLRTITKTQSKYKVEVINKKNTQQSSYNLDYDIFEYLLRNECIDELNSTDDIQNKRYVLSEHYNLILDHSIEIFFDEDYRQFSPKIIFNCTKDSSGNTQKFQLRRKEFNDRGIDYKWFVQLYDNNVEGSVLSIVVDTENKNLVLSLDFKNILRNISDREESTDDIGALNNSDYTGGKGRNIIYYGVPGSGKSYFVREEYIKPNNNNTISVTFFPEYTNADFIGQIMPILNSKDLLEYVFIPGPFSQVLKNSLDNPSEEHFLIIDEINRGSSHSIFGEIFNLLDRDETGKSEYTVYNLNLSKYLGVDKIFIPKNMSIIATMNTSDQNLFTMDNAFKRRWQMEKIPNIFTDEHIYKDYKVPSTNTTWETFVIKVNDHITKNNNILSTEDSRLGIYFATQDELVSHEGLDSEMLRNKFADKVLMYLWEDVAKLNKSIWFKDDINTIDDLIDGYKAEGLKVFKGLFEDES